MKNNDKFLKMKAKIKKMEKIEKNEKIQRKNTKLKKSKNLKTNIFLISYKFGAYIKRFWYNLLTNWHYL